MTTLIALRKHILLISALSLLGISASISQIYVAPEGNDTTNTGGIESPYRTLSKAMSVMSTGDTIFLRGGNYFYSATISISKSGKADSINCLFAFPGELPVFDFTTQTSSDGIKVNGSYWHLKGIESHDAYHNGIAVNGSYNIIEKCVVHDNRNTGLQLGNGASYNQIINCDSYNNFDPPSGGNADGFAPKLDVGTGNYFYGCRAWQNSDDGYDGYLRPSNNVTTTYENCWCFMNGYLKNGTASTGNGNGFKMGGSDDRTLMHNVVMIRCLSFDNRVKGFDQNNDKGSMTLYNCTAYNNGTNYGMSGIVYTDSGKVMTLINCVSLGSSVSIWSNAVQQTNSWLPPFSVSAADFISTDTTGVRGPRKPDGSLPDVSFMQLATASQLIDAGTDVGLSYNGNGPDLGCYEFSGSQDVKDNPIFPVNFTLAPNYPNPFNPVTKLSFVIGLPAGPSAGVTQGMTQAEATQSGAQAGLLSFVTLKIHDLLGREVVTLVSEMKQPGEYTVSWEAQDLPSGAYLCRLTVGDRTQTRRMMLLR